MAMHKHQLTKAQDIKTIATANDNLLLHRTVGYDSRLALQLWW